MRIKFTLYGKCGEHDSLKDGFKKQCTDAPQQHTCSNGETTTLIFTLATASAAKFENAIDRAKTEPRGAVAGSVR